MFLILPFEWYFHNTTNMYTSITLSFTCKKLLLPRSIMWSMTRFNFGGCSLFTKYPIKFTLGYFGLDTQELCRIFNLGEIFNLDIQVSNSDLIDSKFAFWSKFSSRFSDLKVHPKMMLVHESNFKLNYYIIKDYFMFLKIHAHT